MRNRFIHILAALLLLASCGGKENRREPAQPALRAELEEASAFWASFSIQCVECASLRYGLDEDMPLGMDTPSALHEQLAIRINDLEPLTHYTLHIQGIGPEGEEGKVFTLDFETLKGPDNLYPWEARRSTTPSFADITLVTMGWHNTNPPKWTRGRFASHVRYTDPDGINHWLFDAFLCIDGWDSQRHRIYSIDASGRRSADKASWENLLDAWLGDEGALKELDAAVEEASAALGTPPSPRYVVMSVPDPIRFEYFNNRSSSTTYWGDDLDFARVEDQVAACKWFMNQCRERFYARRFRHLELAGFYVLSESLQLDPAFYTAAGQSCADEDTWNWSAKNWELIVPQLSAYAHSCLEGLWWIPYHLAPGYKVWRQLGFDAAFMQPNYYWDHDAVSHPLSLTKMALQTYRMGIELEFEYSLVAGVMADGRSGPDGAGNPTFYAKDVPLLRSRLRECMQCYKDTGLYGAIPLALYSGTDALHQLASSTDPGDREMYHDLCQFIIGSQLKK